MWALTVWSPVPINGGEIKRWRVGDLEINIAYFTISLLITGRNNERWSLIAIYPSTKSHACLANAGHVQVISLWKTLVFILIFQLLSTGSGGLTACVLGGPRRPMLTICSKEDFILKGKFRLNGTESSLQSKSSNLQSFRNLVPMRIFFPK